jgi:hypothetical protein
MPDSASKPELSDIFLPERKVTRAKGSTKAHLQAAIASSVRVAWIGSN